MENGSNKWKRPENVPYPSIWVRFQGCKEINGVFPKFWIQDIPEELFETVGELMINGFFKDEPLCKCLELLDDLVSVKESRDLYRKVLKDKLGLICFMENPNGKPIIAGMNCTYVQHKSEKSKKVEGEKMSIIIETLDFLADMKDPFETLGCNEYLSAFGLYVPPEFRGQGIGLELLKAREALCKAVGLNVTVTFFSAVPSQILAARAGFQDLSVISYADLEKVRPRLKYPGVERYTKEAKYMYKIFNL